MRPKTKILRCRHLIANGTICGNTIAKICNDSVIITRFGRETRISTGKIEIKCERCGQWTAVTLPNEDKSDGKNGD